MLIIFYNSGFEEMQMKKRLSLLLVLLILAVTFINMPTAKATDATQLFNVTTDGFSCDGTITYTVFLKQGIAFSGASIRFKYDSSVLEVKECEPFMTEDSYGDPVENISGIYESGEITGLSGVYGCIFMYGEDNDYTAKSSDEEFFQITFKLKDSVFIPFSETSVEFSCYEFVSFDKPNFNIYNGNEKTIVTFKNLPVEHSFNNNACSFCGCLCFQYIKNESGITVTKYNGRKPFVEIPDSIDSFSVTKIGNGTSPVCSDFIDISIPDSVTNIGANAFYETQFYNNPSNWQNGALYKDSFLIDTNENLPLKYYIDSSTIIADNAFDGFSGYILCDKNSTAHKYALSGGIDFIIPTISSADNNSSVDFPNQLVFTSVLECDNAENIIKIPVGMNFYVKNVDKKYLCTGSVFTVYDGNDYMGDYTLITKGDLNGDGVCDVLDAAATYLYSANLSTPSQNEIYAANGEIAEEIDASDYQNIVNIALNS